MKKPSKKGLYISACGAGLVALCCFTPLAVLTLGAIGLIFFVPYLDYILFPLLVVSIIAILYFYKKWRKECEACVFVEKEDNLNQSAKKDCC